jgi:hypothetical protein
MTNNNTTLLGGNKMYERYAKVEDCGNGFGWSILHCKDEGIFEIAALRGGKYWPNTAVHDPETGYPLRGSWAVCQEVMAKIVHL